MTDLAMGSAQEEMAHEYLAPHSQAHGTARSSLFHPDGYSLWRLAGWLDAGTRLEWSTDHGDEALYVLVGELAAEGRPCRPSEAVIIEAAVETEVTATRPTALLHFGPWSPVPPVDGPLGPAAADGHGLHVVDSTNWKPATPKVGVGDKHYFADSTCPTCRLTFYESSRAGGYVANSHSHSEDELMHVLWGTLQFGRDRIPAGTTIAIPGNHRYGFRAHDFGILNYRRDASTVIERPGSPPQLEIVAPRGFPSRSAPERAR
jgi:hypothetical protein